MKKIVLMPVKNEDWILEYSLSCASLWADYIIIADQNSTDRTQEICKKFDKVIYIKNSSGSLNMSHARQLLLDEARKLGSTNLLFALDADEILSLNCLIDKTFEETLSSLQPGSSVELEWLNFWGDFLKIRKDGVWGGTYKHFIFRDDGSGNFGNVATSEPRMPEKYMEKSIKISTVKNLHYQFVDRGRMLAKQARYRLYDYINSQRYTFWTAFKINIMYYPTKIQSHVILETIPQGWINHEFLSKIKVNSQEYWYNNDVLHQIQKYDPSFFSWLDIWDKEWELPSGQMFKDPRNIFQKLYHKFQFPLYYLNKIIPKSLKNKL